MPDTVVKFGGSNLKSKKDLSKVINTIIAYDKPIVVVVSAFYGITNLLIEKISSGFETGEDVDKIVKDIKERNELIIHENFSNEIISREASEETEKLLMELKRLMLGVHYIRELPDFLEDEILSYGEKFSAVLLHKLLKEKGVNSRLRFPEELPLLTDGEYGNASVNFDACAADVAAQLSGNHIYIIPGFYGITPTGKISVLGRGGSDYSAASIAKCVGAKSLDIWKDVEGFMSGDPKLVGGAVRLDRITYAEAAELAYFGAKILHPRTVEPLIEEHIPIRIFNIDHMDPGRPMSVVNSEEVVKEGVVKSVTSSDDFCIVKLKGPAVGIKPGILARVSGILHKEKINISSVLTSQIAINLVLNRRDAGRAVKLIEGLGLKTVNELLVIKDISLIAIVGQGMLENYGIAARIFSSVAAENINIQLSCTGASQVVTYLLVDNDKRDNAVQAVHGEFFPAK